MTDRPILLFADDEDDVRVAHGRLLREAGYDVRLAATAREALAIARNFPIVVAVVDQQMKRLDETDRSGRELVRRIRSVRPQTRVIVYSGHDSWEDGFGSRDCGAERFVPKSKGAGNLLTVLKELATAPPPDPPRPAGRLPIAQMKRERAVWAMAKHGGDKNAAAHDLDVHVRTVRRWLGEDRDEDARGYADGEPDSDGRQPPK